MAAHIVGAYLVVGATRQPSLRLSQVRNGQPRDARKLRCGRAVAEAALAFRTARMGLRPPMERAPTAAPTVSGPPNRASSSSGPRPSFIAASFRFRPFSSALVLHFMARGCASNFVPTDIGYVYLRTFFFYLTQVPLILVSRKSPFSVIYSN